MTGLLLEMTAMMHRMLVSNQRSSNVISFITIIFLLNQSNFQYHLHVYFNILDNGPYWISYDDQESVELKAQYANFLNLAGCFGWSLETDDFEGRYFDETYPLLRVCV